MPEDVPWADPVAVPDDIRELQSEIDAYHRELRLARRRVRWQRISSSRTWQRWGLPIAIATSSLFLASVVFVLLAVDGAPRNYADTSPAPLAHTSVATGANQGLLPVVDLATDTGASVGSRSLRPALMLLMPLHCQCASLIGQLAGQAAELDLHLVLVAPAATDADVAALPGQIHHGVVLATYDANGTLASAYDATGVTALVLARDGRVTYIERDVTTKTRLELPLEAAMLAPQAG